MMMMYVAVNTVTVKFHPFLIFFLAIAAWVSSEIEEVLKGLEKDEPVPGRDRETVAK